MAPVSSEADLLVDNGDEASLRAALELQPDHVDATLALAELIITNGNKDEALRLLARIPETPEVRHLLALARRGDELRTDGSEVSGKLDALLAKVKTDDAARQEFIDLLELLGPTDERTSAYRKKLTSALF